MAFDAISTISLVLSILIVGSMFLLLIMQINNFSGKKKTENPYFIIALVAGSIAIIANIFDLILWATNPQIPVRNNLNSYTFFFFTLSFYFWYKHYQKIIIIPSSTPSYAKNLLTKVHIQFNRLNESEITIIDLLFFLGIGIDIIYYLLYLLGLNLKLGFIWEAIQLHNDNGRMVTLSSHIAFLSGFVFFYIAYIVITHNLVELNKVLIYELFALVILGFSNLFLFINDIFVTYRIYPPNVSYLIVSVGLFTFFICLIMLLLNFIVLNPPHVQKPSILNDIAQLIDNLDDPVFAKKLPNKEEKQLRLENNPEAIIHNLTIPQKLNGTCIIILIYLMKNLKVDTILAKDLENDLKLNKSTISYNIKILEKNELITRKTPLEKALDTYNEDNLDQRQKFISISDTGKKFLIELNNYLSNSI